MVKKEEILARTSNGLDVFRHYLPVKWRVGRNFLNPLYADSKASCNVYYDRRSGTYRMKDFGNGDYSGDCFFLVAKLKGLDCRNAADFVEVLHTIDRELCLGLEDDSPEDTVVPDGGYRTLRLVPGARENGTRENRSGEGISVRANGNGTGKPDGYTEEAAAPFDRPEPKPYRTTEKPFTDAELAYWGASGITEELLHRYGAVSLAEYRGETKEGKSFGFSSTPAEPMFGYKGKWGVKVYRPMSEVRFVYGGHTGDNYCFGLEQLPAKGDLLFITGGEKDVMSLAAHGFHAICFNSETAFIPAAVIHRLSFRFKHIILLYDVDSTGLKSSAKREEELKEYGVKRLLLPLAGTKTEKDVSDYFMLGNSREDLIKLFLDYLETLYSETMSALKSCEVDFNNPPPIAQMIVSVNDVPLGTQGNLLCITGGEGTGKSNYVAALIAGAIRPTGTDVDALGVTLHENGRNKAVLFYDTEQSEVQLYKNISNLLRRCGREAMPEWFKAYCLTGMSRKERLLSIIQSLDKYHYQYGGVHLVVIDGIADLIKCANDEAESIAVVEELYRLAGIYKTCIVTVLHFIPNGLKLRGHLGSELQRKAAAILSIEKDSDPAISVVKALKVRDGSPLDVPIMQFSWDKEKAMHVYLGEKPKEEKDKRKEDELVAVAKEVFSRRRFVTYVELAEEIQSILEVKERTAKSYIRFMREKEIILKSSDNQSYYVIGNF